MYKYLDNAEVGGTPSLGARGVIFDFMSFSAYDKTQIIKEVKLEALYVFTPGDSTRVALNPLARTQSRRPWTDSDPSFERQYFSPIPLNQITFYKEKGYTLSQNPGWDSN